MDEIRFIKVKGILKLLLIKKNNFTIQQYELDLLKELQSLLSIVNNTQNTRLECRCELKKTTLEIEIKTNQCLDCGLPLLV